MFITSDCGAEIKLVMFIVRGVIIFILAFMVLASYNLCQGEVSLVILSLGLSPVRFRVNWSPIRLIFIFTVSLVATRVIFYREGYIDRDLNLVRFIILLSLIKIIFL